MLLDLRRVEHGFRWLVLFLTLVAAFFWLVWLLGVWWGYWDGGGFDGAGG